MRITITQEEYQEIYNAIKATGVHEDILKLLDQKKERALSRDATKQIEITKKLRTQKQNENTKLIENTIEQLKKDGFTKITQLIIAEKTGLSRFTVSRHLKRKSL